MLMSYRVATRKNALALLLRGRIRSQVGFEPQERLKQRRIGGENADADFIPSYSLGKIRRVNSFHTTTSNTEVE